ncbi:hypothetical protein AB0O07_20615 [Streptomyces sp. NPDC093085]|uniref:hypothetical protein n=1 Tax=Streptomyces sp. NPDC093085 TaxID=3155068 RepID=UPI0034455544
MTTDFGLLTTAAGKWDDMAAEFKKVETRYKESVQSITMGYQWQGASAMAAHTNFAATRYEYKAAQTQAKAIASLLRDAHEQFVELKKRVESARDDAIKAGMKVSEYGTVSYDYAKLSDSERTAVRHDPDTRTIEQSWAKHINDRVKAVDDADKGVKLALAAVVIDSYGDKNDETLGTGFNAHAKGDIELYEAENQKEIATRINNGEKVSAAEWAEFQRAFRDNADNKVFNQTFLNGLGPDGVIKLNDKLNDFTHDKDRKADRDQFKAVQRGLANSVAEATRVPGSVADAPPGSKKYRDWVASSDGKFYREWTEELDKSGTKNFGSNTEPLYGYQLFVDMMDHADRKYDDQFLYALGDDLIAAEKDHPGIFTKWGRGHEGVNTDAVDGLLKVMSKNPDAATAFFDPDGNGTGENHVSNNHLKYLVGSGDDTREWPKNMVTGLGTKPFDDPASRQGLGAALEAATTGHPPLKEGQSGGEPGPHTAAQARVMQETINTLDSKAGGESVHQNLQRNLGRALADYAQDNHNILAEKGTKYGSPEGMDDIWTNDSGKSGITVGKDSLMRVMRGVSSDDQTYALLYDTQRAYAMDQLAEAPKSGGEGHEAWKNPASDVGSVLGAMNSIGSDVILDERDGKIAAVNDQARYAYHFAGAPVTGLPVFGDTAQRLIDAATYEWSKDVSSAASSAAQEKNSEHYASGIGGTYSMIDSWAQDRGVDITDENNSKKDPNWDAWQAMRREAKQSYSSSRGDAAVNLGWE